MESHWQHWPWLISILVAAASFLAIRPRPPFDNRWVTGTAALTVAASTVEIVAVLLAWGTTRPIPDLASAALLVALAWSTLAARGRSPGASSTVDGKARGGRKAAGPGGKTPAPDRLDLVLLSLERLDEAVAVSDPEGRIAFANEAWARLHGHRATDIIGHRWSLFHTPDQLEQQFRPLKRQAEAAGSHEGLVERRRRDGSTVSTRTRLVRLRSSGGKGDEETVGWLAIAREGSTTTSGGGVDGVEGVEGVELAHLAREVAHTFNNLLSAIVGTSGLALERLPESSDLRADLEEIESAAMRASELSGRLQSAAREIAPGDSPPTLAQRQASERQASEGRRG